MERKRRRCWILCWPLVLLSLPSVSCAPSGGWGFVNPQSACRLQCLNGGVCAYSFANPSVQSCICLIGMFAGDRCQYAVRSDSDETAPAAAAAPPPPAVQSTIAPSTTTTTTEWPRSAHDKEHDQDGNYQRTTQEEEQLSPHYDEDSDDDDGGGLDEEEEEEEGGHVSNELLDEETDGNRAEDRLDDGARVLPVGSEDDSSEPTTLAVVAPDPATTIQAPQEVIDNSVVDDHQDQEQDESADDSTNDNPAVDDYWHSVRPTDSEEKVREYLEEEEDNPDGWMMQRRTLRSSTAVLPSVLALLPVLPFVLLF